eukprot:6057946-Amphidinium_carterae.1
MQENSEDNRRGNAGRDLPDLPKHQEQTKSSTTKRTPTEKVHTYLLQQLTPNSTERLIKSNARAFEILQKLH